MHHKSKTCSKPFAHFFLRNRSTHRRAVYLVHAGDDVCGDHDGVSALHLLEHEDSEVEVDDQPVGGVSPGVAGGEHAVGRVAAALRVNQAGGRPVGGGIKKEKILNIMLP